MNRSSYAILVLLWVLLSGCSKTEPVQESSATEDAADRPQASATPVMFPNYLIINAPSSDPDKQWYLSDFFRRAEQWDLESSIDINDLQLGMYELSQYPNQSPTQEHIDSANRIIAESFDVAVQNGWLSKEKGLSDGYEQMYGDPVHFVNVDYVFDGETLNPEKPEVLMYYETNEGIFLMGVMYLAIGQRGPQVAGPLSKWHYHIDRRMCYERGVLPIGTIDDNGECEKGFHNLRSPEMLHVWFFDHPEGRFATKMGLSADTLRFGIEQVREAYEAHQ